MAEFIPADAVGVVMYVDAYGKHSAARVYIRGLDVRPGARTSGSAAGVELEIIPVTSGRSLGSAGRIASNEMELVAHDLPRRKIVLAAPEKSKIKVDQ